MSPARVLLAKPGLDGHDRGIKVVAMALRDAGAEVVYLGQRRTTEQILDAAVQEDVDVIGISILSGAHLPIVRELMDGVVARAVGIPVVVGGTIPDEDAGSMTGWGVRAVFPVGAGLDELVARVLHIAAERSAAPA